MTTVAVAVPRQTRKMVELAAMSTGSAVAAAKTHGL